MELEPVCAEAMRDVCGLEGSQVILPSIDQAATLWNLKELQGHLPPVTQPLLKVTGGRTKQSRHCSSKNRETE